MAHTPGPWFVGYSPEYDIDAGDDGQTIGHLTGKDEFESLMEKITAVAAQRLANEGKLVMTKVVGGFIATK